MAKARRAAKRKVTSKRAKRSPATKRKSRKPARSPGGGGGPH